MSAPDLRITIAPLAPLGCGQFEDSRWLLLSRALRRRKVDHARHNRRSAEFGAAQLDEWLDGPVRVQGMEC